MSIMIVSESVYGNTARVAEAIGTAIREQFPVTVKTIDEVDQIPPDVDVLIVGGPTYAHGVEASMKAFLERIPADSLGGVVAAAFDTRLKWPKFLSGAASKGITEQLTRKGAHMLSEPTSYLVSDKDGPLIDGEVERAAAWGRYLASLVVPAARR